MENDLRILTAATLVALRVDSGNGADIFGAARINAP